MRFAFSYKKLLPQARLFLRGKPGRSAATGDRKGRPYAKVYDKMPILHFALCVLHSHQGIRYNRLPFSKVMRVASSGVMPRISASFSAMRNTRLGSFRRPRKGSGDI